MREKQQTYRLREMAKWFKNEYISYYRSLKLTFSGHRWSYHISTARALKAHIKVRFCTPMVLFPFGTYSFSGIVSVIFNGVVTPFSRSSRYKSRAALLQSIIIYSVSNIILVVLDMCLCPWVVIYWSVGTNETS